MSKERDEEWFDDETFWRETYPFMFSENRFAETPEQMEKVLALTSPSGKKVLDLCTGPGRCALALTQMGFKVTGVDKTRFLLDKAREMAQENECRIEWVQEDMRDFVRENSYDLIINMFTSFGYFDNKEDDLVVLKNIFNCLKPGGIFLIDVMGKECLAKRYQPVMGDFLPDGRKMIQHNVIFDDWSRVKGEWTLIKGGTAKSFTFHHTLYSGQELKDRMNLAGFQNIKLYGNLEGDEYGPNATRLIAKGSRLV